MKKFLCVLLSLAIVISLFVVPFTALAADNQESKSINSFINGITELSREYDAKKNFKIKEEQIAPFSMDAERNASSKQEYSLLDFQTARLIVRADCKFDTLGAKEHISGFEDFHILQYGSPEAAMSAYEQYKTMPKIENVAPDTVVDALQNEDSDSEFLDSDIIKNQEYLCEWSHDRTQADRLLDYMEEANLSLKPIIVAVVDDGVHYDHEFVRDRIERTYFNSSQSGAHNDEYGSLDGHGTAVCSVITDNTPSNVRIRVYKVINDDGYATVTQMCAGFLQAIEDNVNVINSSLAYYDDSGLTTELVERAYNKNIPIFGAVGNDGWQDYLLLPANDPKCIAVSATDSNNTTTEWTTLTERSDISAPGESIAVAVLEDKYALWNGTSFATPCAAALGAILKSVNPDMTVDQIETRLKETSLDVKKYNDHESAQGSSMNNYFSLLDGVGMIQFSNALGLEKFTAPELNLEDKIYVGEQTCTITCSDENATILYTTDGTYPALENATVYTEPFQITQRTRIRAVAYYADGGYYSDEVEATPRTQYTDNDEKFVIDKDGIIKKYSGTISDLYVPDSINGITVTGFAKGAFDNLIGLTLPKTVTEIPKKAFYQNSVLEFIHGEGVITIGDSAFEQSNIIHVEFPNAKEIGRLSFRYTNEFSYGEFSNAETICYAAFAYSTIINFDGPTVKTMESTAFLDCGRLESVYIPQCTELIKKNAAIFGEFKRDYHLIVAEMPLVQNLLNNTFEDSRITKADFPFVKTIGDSAFYNCDALEYINMPSLLSIPGKAFNGIVIDYITDYRFFRLDSVSQIAANAFGAYPTSRIEFSHLETANSLPQTENCIVAMPSTFKKCNEKTIGRNYKVYGTKDTYAEKWAIENGHEFIEISQETALFQDVPLEYTGEETLTVDVIGFNRTYQWYSSNVADNTSGTPIDGATDKEFNPADYPASPYYYCVVTSTDVGYDSVKIRTGVTANKALSADYTAYNEAVAKANAIDRSLYKDLTDLDAALAVDVSGKNITEQSEVDAQTQAILDAIDALVLKDADYTAYDEAVEKANAIDRSLYKDLTDLDAALAVDVSGKNITEQSEVDAQTQAILGAIDALVLKDADYTAYNEAVAKANALDRSLYQDLTALDETLAVDVSGKNITEQAEVDAQTAAILAAIDALKLKPVEPSTTEPEEPTQQPETTNPEEPTSPNDADRPDIPNTGDEKSLQCSFAIFIFTGLWFVTYTVKKKKHYVEFDK